jgi:hypothetical protein
MNIFTQFKVDKYNNVRLFESLYVLSDLFQIQFYLY